MDQHLGPNEANAPVKRRAAKRTVRRKRWFGGPPRSPAGQPRAHEIDFLSADCE